MKNGRSLTLDHIVKHLPQDFECSSDAISSLKVSGSSGRKAYLVNYDDKPSMHLIVGAGLRNVYQRSLSFYAAYPEISAKPLFYKDVDEIGLFGQEHVEGRSLDEIRTAGDLSDSDADQLLVDLFGNLSKGLEKSTKDGARLEFEEVFEKLSRIRYFPQKDLHIISDYVRPVVHDSLSAYRQRRWSNGDMHGRNIMVRGDGKPVLIDCEYAHNTHFFDEDWFRLKTFSSPSVASLECVENRFRQLPIEIKVYHWFRQILLTRSILSGKNYLRCAIVDLCKCIKSLSAFKKSNSILLNSLIFYTQFHEEGVEMVEGYNKTIQSLNSEYNELANAYREKKDAYDDLLREHLVLEKNLSQEVVLRHEIEDKIKGFQAAINAEVFAKEEIHGKFDEAYAAYQMEASLRQELEGKLNQLHKIHSEELEKISALTMQMESAFQLLEEEKSSKAKLLNELKTLEEELEFRKAAHQELQKQFNSLQTTLADLSKNNRELINSYHSLEKNFQVEQLSRIEVESSLSESTIMVKSLKSELSSLESNLKNVQSELQKQKEKVAGFQILNNKHVSLLNNSLQNLRLLEPDWVD